MSSNRVIQLSEVSTTSWPLPVSTTMHTPSTINSAITHMLYDSPCDHFYTECEGLFRMYILDYLGNWQTSTGSSLDECVNNLPPLPEHRDLQGNLWYSHPSMPRTFMVLGETWVMRPPSNRKVITS